MIHQESSPAVSNGLLCSFTSIIVKCRFQQSYCETNYSSRRQSRSAPALLVVFVSFTSTLVHFRVGGFAASVDEPRRCGLLNVATLFDYEPTIF